MTSVPSTAGTQRDVRLGSLPRDSHEGLGFLQARIAFFARIIFTLAFGVFFVLVNLLHWVLDELRPADGLPAYRDSWAHVVASGVLLAVWLVARRRTVMSGAALTALDIGGVVLASLGFAAMGYQMHAIPAVLVSLMAVAFMMIAHAVIVPSTPVRTLWLTAVCLSPVPVAGWLTTRSLLDADPLRPEDPAMVTITLILWLGSATALAVVSSRVVYGLQTRVQEARQLGQYTLIHKIGSGGMGEVYRASHALLRRPTAVKLLSHRRLDEAHMRRFEKEVQLTALLSHPNTIAIYDFGRTPEGTFYYAMEYLEGLDLHQLVRDHGPQRPERVIHILRQICGSLAEAHGMGLIHRDIKPPNVFLCGRGGLHDIAKVLDFGLVKDLSSSTQTELSSTHVITGTPQYLSPEAIADPLTVDARSDLYAVGAVGYYLLTGSNVFDAKTVVEVCGHHLHSVPPPASERLGEPLPDDLERIIMSCLSKQPELRPQDAETMREALGTCRDAGAWTEARARQWWEEQATTSAPTRQDSPADPHRTTVEIDLEQRTAERR